MKVFLDSTISGCDATTFLDSAGSSCKSNSETLSVIGVVVRFQFSDPNAAPMFCVERVNLPDSEEFGWFWSILSCFNVDPWQLGKLSKNEAEFSRRRKYEIAIVSHENLVRSPQV